MRSVAANVINFGADPSGIKDSWSAITAAYNWTSNNPRGTIFFPPGTYLVSQPIVLDVENANFRLIGVYGASTITGNFADYILKRGDPLGSGVQGNTIENLAITNTHATGGGIRLGNCVVCAIRNCTVIANQGISNASDDGDAPLTDLDFNIENCSVSPGSNVSGSNGIMSVADGVILNCRVVGYETGIRLWGNEGNMTVLGCYFEQNISAITLSSPGGHSIAAGVVVSGCWFKDNSTALFGLSNGGGRFCGLRIEASESITVGGGRPQYGIHIADNTINNSLFSGIVVTGQYDQYGIGIDSHAGFPTPLNNVFIGVQSFNTSSHGGLPWHVPSTAYTAKFVECNCPAPVFTMANLPTILGSISSAVWSSGTATLTTSADLSHYPVSTAITVTIESVSPTGYNGTFVATITGLHTLTYTVADPSGSGSSGTLLISPIDDNGTPNTFEGDCYNVSDSNVSTWGGNPVGGGSTHAKVRWGSGGTTWTVVGK